MDPLELRQQLIAALGLAPAEGAPEVTDEQIISAIAERGGSIDTGTFRATLIEKLGLAPAEGAAEPDDAAIFAKLDELTASAGTATTATTDLATAQAELERVRGEYQALFEKEEAARKAVDEAAVNEIMAQYDSRITTPEAKERIRALLLTDREAATIILQGLPPAGAATTAALPPEPMHKEPGEEGGDLTPEQKTAEAEKLIADLRKARPQAFPTYEDARNEIRRQRPELFA